jgi:PRD1 phage membrane DNA delivery
MRDIGEAVAGIIAAIVGVAVIGLIVSSKANTSNVLTAFFGGLSNLVGVAISPVTGQTVQGLTTGLQGGSWQGGGSSGSGGFNPLSILGGGGSGGMNFLPIGGSGGGMGGFDINSLFSGFGGSGGSGGMGLPSWEGGTLGGGSNFTGGFSPLDPSSGMGGLY